MTSKKTRKTAKPITAESIGRLADQGKDTSGFFEGKGRMVYPLQRVNADAAQQAKQPRRVKTS